jgi:hypothetical protein
VEPVLVGARREAQTALALPATAKGLRVFERGGANN